MPSAIIMYADDLGRWCFYARQFFKQHTIPYIEMNVVHDAEARRDFIRMGMRIVPTLVIEGRTYEGFNPTQWHLQIERLYGVRLAPSELVAPHKTFHALINARPRTIFVPSSMHHVDSR